MEIAIAVFIFGSIVGSFLNVCIYRMPKSKSVVAPRSYCPACNKTIMWYDNIPLLSYLNLRGRCRYCGARISPRYFIVELITACLALSLYAKLGLSGQFFSYSVMVSALIVATFVDLEIQEIPDQMSVGAAIAGLVIAPLIPSAMGEVTRFAAFKDAVIGALVGGGIIYFTGIVGKLVFRKDAMGGGDVKLLAMIGAFLGWKLVLFTFFLAPVFGSVAGIILKLKSGKDMIAYGPYLSIAAIVAVFWGNDILAYLFYGLY